MSDGIVVIESAEYGAEVARLVEDPIIQGMAKGVPSGVDLTDWGFISRASRYYVTTRTELGLDKGEFGSIGGPAKAIRKIKEADGTAREGVVV